MWADVDRRPIDPRACFLLHIRSSCMFFNAHTDVIAHDLPICPRFIALPNNDRHDASNAPPPLDSDPINAVAIALHYVGRLTPSSSRIAMANQWSCQLQISLFLIYIFCPPGFLLKANSSIGGGCCGKQLKTKRLNIIIIVFSIYCCLYSSFACALVLFVVHALWEPYGRASASSSLRITEKFAFPR